ncbi:hypothetical protein [Rhizobium sp. G21]|uniref:hypothetical protein n=1 Tax=Rhizobium sp. G21 TaxID=2758439 RepID=UPI001604281F|nr:hypothetical protein [Rhizobium sp. G21]MBB1248428.1 hypothetical protein [Rhizobium sp. G21]
MTVPKTTDDTIETIRFPITSDEQREQRLRRRAARQKLTEDAPGEAVIGPASSETGRVISVVADEALAPRPAVREPAEVDSEDGDVFRTPKKRFVQVSWTNLSFILFVVIPGAMTAFYFMFLASPQYVVESQFSVRGSNASSMSSFGLGSLFGTSVQSNDSYIVSSYIESQQLVRDVRVNSASTSANTIRARTSISSTVFRPTCRWRNSPHTGATWSRSASTRRPETPRSIFTHSRPTTPRRLPTPC